MPEALAFATKPATALKQIEHLMGQAAPRHCVWADAGHGVDTAFRERLSALGLHYGVGVTASVTVWPAPACGIRGRRVIKLGKRLRLGGFALPQHHPQSIKALALELGPKHWHTVTWRQATNAKLRSRFAPAQRHVPSLITRLRLRSGSLLAQNLPRCPSCLRVQEGLRYQHSKSGGGSEMFSAPRIEILRR